MEDSILISYQVRTNRPYYGFVVASTILGIICQMLNINHNDYYAYNRMFSSIYKLLNRHESNTYDITVYKPIINTENHVRMAISLKSKHNDYCMVTTCKLNKKELLEFLNKDINISLLDKYILEFKNIRNFVEYYFNKKLIIESLNSETLKSKSLESLINRYLCIRVTELYNKYNI